MRKKVWLSVVALALVFCCAVGVTLAWLTDRTDPVTNTFTVGDIDIDLAESADLDLKMIPGKEIKKDPKVTVNAGSEACWLFVKVEKSANFADFLTYEMADGWEPLDGEDGVFWRKVDAATANAGASFAVLKGDKVTVKDTVTKEDLQAVKNSGPDVTMTFTAYAVQQEGIATAADAWKKI